MPKINASTVAEHRAHQREALIGAAIDILVNEGATAVTPAAVGARAGLARSSVYQYFDSSAALLATITEEAFRRSNEALARRGGRRERSAGTRRRRSSGRVSASAPKAHTGPPPP